jgi:hypothetical protein
MTALCDLGYSSLDEPVRVRLARSEPLEPQLPSQIEFNRSIESEMYFFVLKMMVGISLVELAVIFFLMWKLLK